MTRVQDLAPSQKAKVAPKKSSRRASTAPRAPRKPRELARQEKAADALFERIGELSGAAGEVEEILAGLLKLPPDFIMWTDVLSEFAKQEHADLPTVYRALIAGLPDNPETSLAYLHWEAADQFSRRGLTDLLPEVSEALCQLHHDAYSSIALVFVENFLLAADYEEEALRLAEHFLPRTREDVRSGKLFPMVLDEQCALITHLRIGRLLRAGFDGEPQAAVDALRHGFEKEEVDEGMLRRVAATLLAPARSRPWTLKDFALPARSVGVNAEIRRAQELYLTLLIVAREAWQKKRQPPGRTFQGLTHVLGYMRQSLERKQRGQAARPAHLMDYMEASGLQSRIEGDCVREMAFIRPQAQVVLDACRVLLNVAQEHHLLAASELAATVEELERLGRMDGH